MLHRRDAIRLLASSALTLAAAEAGFQQPGQAQRKAGRPGVGAIEDVVEEILGEFHIAGASIAMARGGKLVLARGFGLTDVEAKKPVTPQTLFSTASVTKPITAVAVLKLVEQGKLKLDARLMELFADIAPPDGPRPADPRFREITIHQLLYHASGLDREVPPDEPRAQTKANPKKDDDKLEDEPGEFGASSEELIRVYRTALGRPLAFAPGSESRYSNLGFVLLRFAIERVTGLAYEPFVREQVLAPMGIRRMVMETDAFIPEETRRYASGPNGFRRLPGHKPSNWLATPTDLVRFLTAVAGTRGRPFLSEKTVRQMLAVPPQIKANPNGRHVGLGWDVVQHTPQGDRYSKNGGKPGARAWLEHLPEGVDWAFQFNTTEQAGPPPKVPAALPTSARRVEEAVQSLKRWPEVDLFQPPKR